MRVLRLLLVAGLLSGCLSREPPGEVSPRTFHARVTGTIEAQLEGDAVWFRRHLPSQREPATELIILLRVRSGPRVRPRHMILLRHRTGGFRRGVQPLYNAIGTREPVAHSSFTTDSGGQVFYTQAGELIITRMDAERIEGRFTIRGRDPDGALMLATGAFSAVYDNAET